METEVPKVPAKKKEPSKRAAAAQKKKPLATVSEISDDDDDDYNDINEIDDDDDDDDEDSEIEVVATPEARKKGGGKLAANAKAVKAPAAAKKRGAANKQQPQTLAQVGKVNEVTENEENWGSASTSASTEETIEVAPARARPQRVNQVRKQGSCPSKRVAWARELIDEEAEQFFMHRFIRRQIDKDLGLPREWP
uniref:Uncharacterized protein n=1 Tax=Quercus lobata TaxID=97700 RepID=A0A7N2N8L4_QUELO